MKRLIALTAALAACGSSPKKTTTPPQSMPASSAASSAAQVGPPAFPDEPFRAKQPAPAAAKDFKAPPIVTFQLKNGIDVYLVERHDLPVVSMSLVVDGGAASDPDGDEGLASMCMDLAQQGTEKLTKTQFEESLADIASEVSASAGPDTVNVDMSTLTKHLDATLDLWSDVIQHPGLRKDDFDRLEKDRLNGLTAIKGDPRQVGRRLVRNVVFGPKHPYGRVPTEKSYKAITLAACQKFVKGAVAPQGARLFVAGDITRADIEAKVGARLAGMKGKSSYVAKVSKATPRDGRVFFVDVPNAVQSVLTFVEPGPDRMAPDYFPTYLAGMVFGGDFSSRLNMEIREKKGYAYGAFGGFQYTRAGGLFVAQAAVRADATKDAIADIAQLIQQMTSGDVTDDELATNKDGEVLAMPAWFATAHEILGQYEGLVYFGLPLDYYDKFVPSMEAVTKDAVVKAAKDHIFPDKTQLLIVGDAKTQLAGVQQLVDGGAFGKNAKLTLLDADGNVVPPPKK